MFESVLKTGMSPISFFLCMVSAIGLGVLTSLLFMRGRHSRSLSVSLALLPAVVALVIMLVNGNIGAGIAVAGSFSLVRFRSIAGTAREIAGLFFAVVLGMCCGMGYIFIAALFYVMIALTLLVLERLHFGETRNIRQLRITIPEDLDYEGLFDDLFDRYASSYELVRVRTTNMGTLYELSYEICLKDAAISKSFIDEIRCRNGNLNVICGRELENEQI